jgi:hypothetical protein
MGFIAGGKFVGRDNRASGSPAGRENMSAGTPYPVPFVEANRLTTAISASISFASEVATVTCTAHGLNVGNIVRITGADQAAYNGHHRVTVRTDANEFKYTVYGSPDAATGTILAQKVHQEVIGD